MPAGIPGQGGRGPIVVPATTPPPGASALIYVGRAAPPYASATSPQGPDGSCDEKWNGTTWSQTDITSMVAGGGTYGAAGSFLASGCYSAALKQFGLFGNSDASPLAQIYDVVSNTYFHIADTPGGSRGQGCAVVVGNNAWIFSGWNGSVVPGNAVVTYDMTQALNTSGSYMTLGATTPQACLDPFCCYDSTSALIYYGGGGNTDDPSITQTCYQGWYSLDPSNPTSFTTLATIPTKRSQAACAVLSGNIYVIGGSVDGGHTTQGTTNVYRYSISGNSWTTMNAFPVATASGRAAVVGGKLYCAPGWNSSGFSTSLQNADNHVYVYDPGTDSWSTLAATLIYGAPGAALGGF